MKPIITLLLEVGLVQIIVNASTTGVKINNASVTSSVSDPNSANNSASASTNVGLGLYLPYVCKN